MTYLQMIMEEYENLVVMMDQAAATEDPLRRLELALTGVLAGLHRGVMICDNKGPLNPTIGETFQAVNQSGVEFHAEQVGLSTSVWTVKGQGWDIEGWGELKSQMTGANSLKGMREGKNVVKFADGCHIQWENATLQIAGLVMGERIVNYLNQVQFTCTKGEQQFEANVRFNEQEQVKKGMFASWKSYLKDMWSYSELPKDFFEVIITSNGQEVKRGNGSWLEYVTIDGERTWTMADQVADEVKGEPAILLPSDSRFRKDAQYIAQQNWAEANQFTSALMDAEQRDSKLRQG